MNAVEDGKAPKIEKQFPGCLGVMVNLFDVSAGLAAGNKLLTDKPHYDGSPLSRSRSDVAVMVDPLNRNRVEDTKIMPEIRRSSSNRKSSGTPIKMLIAQEMSKEVDFKQSPPNVVAKLMGLDALPIQLPNSLTRRGLSKGHTQHNRSKSLSGIQVEYSQHARSYSEMQMQRGYREYKEYGDYNDIYDLWQQPQKANSMRENSPQNGRPAENVNEKKMALVRQKFVEAKRLAPDEKLRQSKEFQDAIEVLSSNRDLFLKFLQEPNSLISRHLHELQSIPPPPETKRITILKPSKLIDDEKFSAGGKKNESTTKRSLQVSQESGWDKDLSGYPPGYACQDLDDYATQPTRIVVLKPGHGKDRDVKSLAVPPSASPGMNGDNLFPEIEDVEAEESREVAKEITRQIRQNLAGHRRDETLLSSAFSNGYIGDDSSCNKSDTEYADGNLSDSEAVSPTSRHSWEFLNRVGSPYSTSSFSRASYSPESSVCREAKKRLSERWALMASNQNSLEQKPARKSSSTLGEMLALSDGKKSVAHEVNENNKDQKPPESIPTLPTIANKEEAHVDSLKNLSRSKSLPASSTVYDDRVNVEQHLSEEPTKKTNGKSSLKWRVSSLFFSRSKKSSKEKSSASQSEDVSQSGGAGTPVSSLCPPEKVSSSVSNHGVHTGLNENHDQPSPVSVLDQSFEHEKTLPEASGRHISSPSLRSNLIDKSPPIGSIARTLSWDDSYLGSASPYLLKTPTHHSVTEEERQDWLDFVQTLISAAGLDGEVRSDSFISSWHSPESPLDPSLRDKLSSQYDKEPLPEAKRRQRRSNRKLAFDCVNATIIEIAGNGSDRRTADGARSGTGEGTISISVDGVWARMKGWFCDDDSCVSRENGDRTNLVVERVVKNEVVGRGWVEHLTLETDNLGTEIEGKLLEELVAEAVVDLAGRV